MKVYIETYGCQMNEYDSELVRAILKGKQYTLTTNPEDAEVVLVNTCAVREHAHQKIYSRLGELRRLKDQKHGRLVIGVLGCMAQNLRQALAEQKPIVDIVAGPDTYKRLPLLIEQVKETGQKAFDFDLSEFETYSDVYPERVAGVNAWIAVMRGCDNFCTFCVVPYTRGRERSRSPESVVEETCRLVQQGYKQVTLLGQNVNSYRYEDTDFAGLMQRVSEVDGICRVRFTSPHPKDFPDRLLDVIAENPKVCKHIHLPLQAGNDRILQLMNRTYTRAEFLGLVEKIRKTIPGVVLTTDIIVGFPTETEEEFLDTCAVMKDVEFDSAFVFKYSPRKGTIAARKYRDDVPEEKKSERCTRLNELQRKISLKKNKADLGKIFKVLVEGESRKSREDFTGKTDGNKTVVFPRDGPPDLEGCRVGDLVDVRIHEATPTTLLGTMVRASG